MAPTTRSATHANAAKASAEAKGKKPAVSALGAPSQRTQSSRKGKKAWRKNIDIDDVEETLESVREEERVLGAAVHEKKDDELFVVDVTGDNKVRRNTPKYSKGSTTAAKILAQRSAVPAVFARATTDTVKRKRLSHEEKDRLLRIGKRPRKGPFNAVMDHTELGAGSALLEVSAAVKQSGGYDVWGTGPAPEERQEEDEDDTEAEADPSAPKPIKAPTLPHPRQHIHLSAVVAPHEGMSYNPPVSAHQQLLRSAVEKAEQRAKEAEENKKTKETIEKARRAVVELEVLGVPSGMTVQEVVDEDEDEGKETDALPAKTIPQRKTKKERRKADKLRADKRALAEKLAAKRMLASVQMAKSLRKHAHRSAAARERVRQEQHQQEVEAKLKNGLAGQRLGRHIVPAGDVDVQLTEDLSENLRTLKVEGNLFKDRFVSMQHRALIEPRVPVQPKRKAKMKEYEKHAWKRFEREEVPL